MPIIWKETECYICTEPTEEKSPCVCGAHVHMKCLVEWIEKNDNKRYTCSICHSELEGIRPAKSKSSIVYKSTYRPGLIDGGHMCVLILKMILYTVFSNYYLRENEKIEEEKKNNRISNKRSLNRSESKKSL